MIPVYQRMNSVAELGRMLLDDLNGDAPLTALRRECFLLLIVGTAESVAEEIERAEREGL